MIIAQLESVDPEGVDLHGIVPLREAPFSGDVIRRTDGTLVRVLRRTFNELTDGGDDQVDVVLGVRLA